MAHVTFPLKLDFITWVSQIRQDLPNLSIPNPPNSLNEWREWAAQFVNDASLADVPVPTRLAYPKDEDWKIWAGYFVDSVYNSNI